jgi:hypothetical protein
MKKSFYLLGMIGILLLLIPTNQISGFAVFESNTIPITIFEFGGFILLVISCIGIISELTQRIKKNTSEKIEEKK